MAQKRVSPSDTNSPAQRRDFGVEGTGAAEREVTSPTRSVGAPSWLFTARRPEGVFPARAGEAVLPAPTQLCSLPERPVTTWNLELRALDRDGALCASTALATFGWPSGQLVLFEARAETLVVRA